MVLPNLVCSSVAVALIPKSNAYLLIEPDIPLGLSIVRPAAEIV
tara:strand:- start:118 stop:249 length:132 start_codon:yes stop_codon:yes gene_type:complete